MKKILAPLILLLLVGAFFFVSGGNRHRVYEAHFYDTFDTVVMVRGYAKNQAAFDRGFDAAYDRMKALHALFDIYHAYDGINNLHTINNQAGLSPVSIEPDIIDLLLLAREGYDLTHGTVNVAMGSVLTVWHTHREDGLANPQTAALPSMDALQIAALTMDINDLVIDEINATVFLRQAGMSLDVGSIAKSYAAGLALQAAQEAGLMSVVINAGGSVTAGAPPLDGRSHWRVGVQSPELSSLTDTVMLHDLTLSCSGGYQRFYVVDGAAYSHIIDPATLMPPDRYQKVAVIHPEAWLADVLSTALFILPLADGRQLAARYDAQALWLDAHGAWHYTDGYARMSTELGGDGAR